MAGATQLMMGVDTVVACAFEFLAYFVVDYFIRLVGHAGIMYIGLVGYAVRYVVYASIRNPWTVLPVEALQGPLFYCPCSRIQGVLKSNPPNCCQQIKSNQDLYSAICSRRFRGA